MPTDEDPFERAARREKEIAEELARGRLTSEQAEQLRDLLGPEAGAGQGQEAGDPRRRLTAFQLRRVLEEGVDPDALLGALRHLPGLSVDEVIDLLVDLAPEEDFFVGLGGAELAGLDFSSVVTLLEQGVEPDDLARLRRAGLNITARDAARLCEEGTDLCQLADLVERAESIGGTGVRLSPGQLVRSVREGIDLDQIMALTEIGVDADQAIDLAGGEVDPVVLRRLLDDGVEIDWNNVIGTQHRSVWSGAMIGFKGRRRHVGLILGDHVVGSDAAVSGAVLGTVTVRPGAQVTIDALVTGDVVVQLHASVLIRGTVRGKVRNRGGRVEVAGSVRGGVEDEVDQAV
jgi:hypothetical protein